MYRTSRLLTRVPQGQPAIAKNPFSWKGLEGKRDRLQWLAERVKRAQEVSDAVAKRSGYAATGIVVSAIRDPSSVIIPEAVTAANLHLELSKLQQELVWEDGLDFDFVRREWATILDPSQHELELCEKNIVKNKKAFEKLFTV